MLKSSYPPEIITVKVQNNAQQPSKPKKSVFQRLGSKKSGAADLNLSLEEQCKELRRQIKMEGSSSATKKRATRRPKESSSSSDSSSGSSSDSSSSSSSSESSSRRKSKKIRKTHHHSSSSVDHLAAKIRKSSAAQHRHGSSSHGVVKSASSSASKVVKKHKPRVLESPPHASSSRRRSASASPTAHRSRKHLLPADSAKELKKRDSHRSKEIHSGKDSRSLRDSDHNSRLHHDSIARARSRSPHLSRSREALKRRLSPVETKRHSPMRSAGTRSLTRNPERSVDRDRERREKEREERELARNKEREEALMRCQERQRERERLARERERKERSREKSLERDKVRSLHSSSGVDRRSTGGGGSGSARDLHHTPRTAAYDRRASPPGETYDYERSGGESYRDQTPQSLRSRSHREGTTSGSHHHHHREYEKEYVRPVASDRSPYEEVGTPRSSTAVHDKYRGPGTSGPGSHYEYEHTRGRSEARLSYGEVRVRSEWEEEKIKVREVPRERIIERVVVEPRVKEWGGGGGGVGNTPYRGGDGPKEWNTPGGGHKWESPKFTTPGGNNSGPRDEMWPRDQQNKEGSSWRNSSFGGGEDGGSNIGGGGAPWQDHSTGNVGASGHNAPHFGYNAGNHHNSHQQQHHQQQQGGGQQQQQPPQQQHTPRMMGPGGGGPRFHNDSWQPRPRFGGPKKDFFRHQFQPSGHDGPGGGQGGEHARYSNPKRFGEYHQQAPFAPRGTMNAAGPKFNTPVHAQQQQMHNQQTAVQPLSSATVSSEQNTATGQSAAASAKPPASVPVATVPNSAKIEDVGTPTEDEKKIVRDPMGGSGADDAQEGDNLSEFSDDGDEILDKNDEEMRMQREKDEANSQVVTASVEDDCGNLPDGEEKEAKKEEERAEADDLANQDDLTLDFEEISDGELEEESAKVKGLGDALGVDWAGLVAEPRMEKKLSDSKTTVKEMWEPKRIFRDVGISLRMAGPELAQRLLGELDGVVVRIKKEPIDEEEQNLLQLNGGTNVEDVKGSVEPEVNVLEHPVAGCQVALRKKLLARSKLIMNRNGTGGNQVALCARRDLQIRRQLCGLPAWEIHMSPRQSADPQQQQQENELKALAREVFAKATAVH